MSIPLLGFSVTSSHCSVSRLLTWSLFLSVPRFLYLDGSSSVLLGGVQPSPPVPRLSLGWPTCSISILQLSLLLCSWGFCSSSFPPSRLWSSRLAFSSVAVPLVFSWLLLECSYSPQLVCGFSRVSASCLAPAFGGTLPRVSLFCVFGLYRFGFLPFLLLRCLTAWWLFPLGGLLIYGCLGSLSLRSSAVVLSSVVCLQSSFPTLVVVLLIPPSSFRTPSVSVGCVPSAFAMGSP